MLRGTVVASAEDLKAVMMRNCFEVFDSDRDGCLTVPELESFLRAMNLNYLHREIVIPNNNNTTAGNSNNNCKKNDDDNNYKNNNNNINNSDKVSGGGLSKVDFYTAASLANGRKAQTSEEVFAAIGSLTETPHDAEDVFVSADTLKFWLTSMGEELSNEEVDAVFDATETPKAGDFSFKKFIEIFNKTFQQAHLS